MNVSYGQGHFISTLVCFSKSKLMAIRTYFTHKICIICEKSLNDRNSYEVLPQHRTKHTPHRNRTNQPPRKIRTIGNEIVMVFVCVCVCVFQVNLPLNGPKKNKNKKQAVLSHLTCQSDICFLSEWAYVGQKKLQSRPAFIPIVQRI